MYFESISDFYVMQATEDDSKKTKARSIVCPDCEGNGK